MLTDRPTNCRPRFLFSVLNPDSFFVRLENETIKFASTISQGTKFSAFMEAFSAKVGVPQDRASEAVFKFDGDKLNPASTPEVELVPPVEL